MFPLYARHAGPTALLARMLREHMQLQGLARELRAEVVGRRRAAGHGRARSERCSHSTSGSRSASCSRRSSASSPPAELEALAWRIPASDRDEAAASRAARGTRPGRPSDVSSSVPAPGGRRPVGLPAIAQGRGMQPEHRPPAARPARGGGLVRQDDPGGGHDVDTELLRLAWTGRGDAPEPQRRTAAHAGARQASGETVSFGLYGPGPAAAYAAAASRATRRCATSRSRTNGATCTGREGAQSWRSSPTTSGAR